MIIDLPSTTTGAVGRKLVDLRDTGGAIALGRVLTLVIVTDEVGAEEAIEAANSASREHPCRVIVIVQGNRRGVDRLDAQIRVGGDAGASEVIVLRLYGKLAMHGDSVVTPLLLPDAPLVVWWPGEAPKVPIEDPIGQMAQRRITDAAESRNPRKELDRRREGYSAGDTDLAWTRVTKWRGLLAAALDQPPYEAVTAAVVSGAPDSPSTDLLAAWLAQRLKVPVQRVATPRGSGISAVRLERRSGPIDLVRPGDVVATLSQPGQPDRRITLPRREAREILADELRRLDPDDTYEDALLLGIEKLTPVRLSAEQAARTGKAPSPDDSRRLAARLRRDDSAKEAMAMVTAPPAPDTAETAQVRSATRRKLAGEPTPREEKAAEQGADQAADQAADQTAPKPPKSRKTPPTRKASS